MCKMTVATYGQKLLGFTGLGFVFLCIALIAIAIAVMRSPTRMDSDRKADIGVVIFLFVIGILAAYLTHNALWMTGCR